MPLQKRRSHRTSQEIIAPGFGTRSDLERLARDLSSSSPPLDVEAVQAMMESRGRSSRRSDATAADESATAAAPVSSAWADFMKEEGDLANASGEPEGAEATAAAADTASRVYQLEKATKKKAKSATGVLVQAGTLDCRIVGRSKSKIDVNEAHFLAVPTRILGNNIQIRKVIASGHACHSLALATGDAIYAWGRNEQQQLSTKLPDNVFEPTLLEDLPPGTVSDAAVGKSHTLLLIQGTVYAAGSNKVGQCGVSVEQVPNFRKATFPKDMESTVVQVACGEDFSVAVCSEGFLYTTGSSEFGQLGNGSTGEHFVTANKIAFANEKSFCKRTTFSQAPNEKLYSSNDKTAKVIDLNEDIRIQQVACGKHHVLALEAESDRPSRVFSWGCGNYGVLGHGAQVDEYYPRLIGTLAHAHFAGAARSVAAGQLCSLFQTTNGHVYYWGKHRSVGEATMRPTLVDVLANNQHNVIHVAAGGQTVVCCTANAQTVAWGQGGYGELGLGEKKSSAKPTFVTGLDGCQVISLACGNGHSLFVVEADPKAIQKLPELDPAAPEKLAKGM